jgi:predicted component of type VI protein secretion system
MSTVNTIKLEIPFNDNNVELVKALLSKATAGDVKSMRVVDAEEVKTESPAKATAPRASRAKPKAPPVEEEEIEEELDDELEEEEIEDEEAETTADDIRTEQAKKVGKHKTAIIAKLAEFDAKGISSLDEKHFAKYYDFLTKLK